MQRFFNGLRFVSLFFGAALGAASLGAAELVHNPVLSAAAGQDVQVEASLVGATGDPRVRLFWRPRGKEIFRSVEMGGGSAGLNATIPGEGVDLTGVEYYIEASIITAGKKTVIATSPSNNPLLNPHAITVRKDQSGPEVTPLSPGDGETLDSSRPVITASFGDPDSGIDPASVLIKIDGEAINDKGNVQAFDSLVSYVPGADLGDGEHEITVVVRDRAGNPGSAKWTVKVDASSTQKGAAKQSGFIWDGKAAYQTQYGAVLNQSKTTSPLPYRPYGLNRGILDVNGRGADSTLRLKVDKSDAERTDQQPIDRYTATYKSRQGTVAIGDYSPNFSELSLWNLYQLRGVTLDLQSGRLDQGHTRLVGVYGQTRRAVEQGATGLAGGTAGSLATFAQYLYGARWEFGGPWFQMGMNAVTVNDEGGSITAPGGQLPRYNTISTSDVQIGLPLGLKLKGETGVDLYSDPSPLLGSSLGSAYRAGLDWNIKAWDTRLGFDWKDLGGGFGLLPGGYTTAANPGLEVDYRGYEASFSQGLFDGQFSLDLNLNRWRDNLQDNKGATTINNFLSVFTNIAPEQWPYLVIGYTSSGGANDAVTNTASVLVTDNKTTVVSVGLGYTKAFTATNTGSLNLNWSRNQYADQAPKKLSQDQTGDNFVLTGFTAVGQSSFNASLGFSNSVAPALAAAATASGAAFLERADKGFNASLTWNQAWVRSVLDSYVGYDLSTHGSESTGFKQADNRSTFSVGGGYAFKPDQKLSAKVAFASAGSEIDTAGTKVNDSVTEAFTDLRYDLSF